MRTKLIFILLITLISCQGLRVEKRRYTKGFFVQHGSFNLSKNNNKVDKIHPSSFDIDKKDPIILETKKDSLQPSSSNLVQVEYSLQAKNKKYNHKLSGKFRLVKSKSYFTETNFSKKTKNKTQLKHDKNNSAINKSITLPAYVYYLPFLLGIFLFRNKKRNTISNWAFQNPKKARWLIAGLHVLLSGTAYALGELINRNSISVSDVHPIIYGAAFFIPAAVYSQRKKKNSRINFKRLGIFLLSIAGTFGSFMMGIKSAFTNSSIFSQYSLQSGLSAVTSQDGNPMIMHPIFAILLTILLLGLLYGLGMLLAVIACELSCSGYGFLAVIVFYGGNYLNLSLCILAILHIWKREKTIYPDQKARNRAYLKKAFLISLIIIAAFTLVSLFFII